MSDPNYQPDTSTLRNFTDWWKTHQSSMTADMKAKYDPYLKQLNTLIGWSPDTGEWDKSKWPTYNPIAWEGSQWQKTHDESQQGMESLLARLGAGPQASDTQWAQDQAAQSYGYSPASWTALQGSMDERMNASNVMAEAASTALAMEETPFGQEQAKAMRVAQRQAEESVGKQLEAIFGERGGLAGFSAAYDLTSQLQSSFLQQQSKNSLDMFDRAISQVNAENQYYQQLIQQGAIDAKDYLKFRWDSLQTGYQDYLAAMDQAMKEWTTAESVNEQQYATASKVIQDQINSVTSALSAQMGIDESVLSQMEQEYALYSQQAQDEDAANKKTVSEKCGEILSTPLAIVAWPVLVPVKIVSDIVGC